MKKKINILLSVVGSLYFLAASMFHPSYAVGILGLFVVIGLIFNLLIFEESIRYDGQILVSKSEEGTNFVLQLEATPEELAEKNIVSFKIVIYPKS